MKIRSIAAALALLLPLAAAAQMRINIGPDSPLRKLQMAELAIANLYVDSVDEQKLVEDGIRGMIEKLDPHSSYSTAKEVKALTEPLAGNFEGIGVQFNMIADTMLVIQPVAGGPSERVGILAGDRIVAVNDTAIAGVNMPRDEIMRRLRGPKGTKVDLEVVRRGYSGKLAFTVTRDKIVSRCGWSPFEGHTFPSTVIRTIVNGTTVYDNGNINENYRGKLLSFLRD